MADSTVTKRRARPPKLHREWRTILEACVEHGKETVLAALERHHSRMEHMEAAILAEPGYSIRSAHRLSATLLRQDETMIRLRQLTDADIRRLLGLPPDSPGQPTPQE